MYSYGKVLSKVTSYKYIVEKRIFYGTKTYIPISVHGKKTHINILESILDCNRTSDTPLYSVCMDGMYVVREIDGK